MEHKPAGPGASSGDPDRFYGKPEEFLAWAAREWKFNPSFCPRHWMPCPVQHKPGLLVSVIVMTESFAFLPPGVETPEQMNSWQANRTTPTCCMLGDAKMSWLWWVVDQDEVTLCKARTPEQGVSVRVCWRPAGHFGEHEWERPPPRSVFDLMGEVRPRG